VIDPINRSWRRTAGVLASYTAIALLFSWPLATHLDSAFTGAVTGDTGVYVWNQWVFQHELIDHRTLPYFTDRLFGPGPAANLSLHNYTTFQNLVALPLIPLFGVVVTFNVVYLLMTVLTAYATFLLARRITGRTAEAWLAGVAFAWSPFIVTRGTGHFSVAAAAPLPLFLLLLQRAAERQRLRDGLALAATMWFAASCDVYYAVYCLLIAVVFITARVVSVHRSATAPSTSRAVRWALDVAMLSLVGLIVAIVVRGGFQFHVLGRAARMRSLYTPMLALTCIVMLRIAWRYRTSIVPVTKSELWRFAHLTAAMGVGAAILLAPALYAVSLRIADGSFESPRIFWRSSPPGVDLLALLMPNPNHPLAPPWLAGWLAMRANGYIENVASLPLLALAIILFAARRGWRPSRWWVLLTAGFALLALGPFVQIGGVNTAIPGPWALLRYVPIVGLARTPARFAVVLTLGVAILFASALTWLGRQQPSRRTRLLVIAGALLAFELLPAPITLYSANIPSIYKRVAAAPDDVGILELPFGVRDGTSSLGNFTARTQFFQTAHGKTIMGGYLSRVSKRRIRELRADPVLNPLVLLSENRPVTADQERQLMAEAPAFAHRNSLGFVIIDRARTSETLRTTAIRAFRLQRIDRDREFELYAPAPSSDQLSNAAAR
jgi:hypothetical protein